MKSSTPSEYFDWQKRLEPAIKIMIEGIMILDTEGRIVYVNDSAERMLGRDKNDIIGRSFTDHIWDVKTPEGLPFPEEDRPFSRAMREDKPVYGIELSVLRPDGSRPVLSFNAIPLHDETGAQMASVETFSDITDRKKTEEELWFKSLLLDSATDAIIVHDFDGNILYANEAAYKKSGYSKEELLSMSLFGWVAPEARERIKPNLEKIMKVGSAIFESVDIKKDGTVFPVEVHARVIEFGGKQAVAGIIRDITERKKAEQERERLTAGIDAQRRLYETVVTDAPAGIAILCPPDYRFEYLNPVFQAIAPGKEMSDKPFSEVWSEVAPQVLPIFDEVLRTGEPYVDVDAGFMVQRRLGSPPEMAYFTWRCVRIHDLDCAEQALLLLIVETTERVLARKNADELSRRMGLVLQSTDEGLFGLDNEGRCTFFNKAASEMTGFTPEEVLGTDIHALIHHSRADGSPYPVEECLTTHSLKTGLGSRTDTEVFWRKDGTSFPVEYSSYPVTEGVLRGAVVAFSDITQRKQADESLKESEERFRAVVESATDAVVGCLKGGTEVSLWNKAAETIFGYTADEICGQPLALIIPERYRQGHREGIRNLTEKGVTGYLGALEEFVGLRKDGSEFPIEISLGAWTGKAGVSFTAVIRDITERKRAEEEIREHHEELKERDRAIRTAYVDVLGAVTGGKLVLMTPEEIEEALSVGLPLIETQTIFSYAEMTAVRQTMREAVVSAAPDMDPDKFIVAFSEALTNAVKHSGSGICRLFKVDSMLQIVIADAGAGIDFSTLPKATLMPGFSTKGTLGMGFSIMLEVCDRVLLSTQPGNTTLVLELGV